MSQRSDSQRIGEEGHRLAMYQVATNPDWIVRDLGQDYGVDAEAELAKDGVRGEILKLQFRSSEHVTRKNGDVEFTIDRGLIDYAESCRYPVVLLRIDVQSREVWYLWLQRWLLDQRAGGGLKRGQDTFTVWVCESNTLAAGLRLDLKDIARWRGEAQLVLSLLDALRAAAATHNARLIESVLASFHEAAPKFAAASLDVMLHEAVELDDLLRGSQEGLVISDQVFKLVRKLGGRATLQTVDVMVRRNDAYSRTGIVGLGILYDEHFCATASLGLVQHFLDCKLASVSYYCALREANPDKKDVSFIGGPGDFTFAGLKFGYPKDGSFMNKWANRGSSAILDYLVPIDVKERDSTS